MNTSFDEESDLLTPSEAFDAVSWKFSLHDIDQNGIPELFVVIRYGSGHRSYHAVFSFSDGKAVQLDFDKSGHTDGGIRTSADNSPWIIFCEYSVSAGWYSLMKLNERSLVTFTTGSFFLSDAGRERLSEFWELGLSPDIYDSYDWHNLSITDNNFDCNQPLTEKTVTVEEFERVFGRRNEKRWIAEFEISEDNINSIIYGYEP
jgi:hypothetical protein